MLEIVNDFKVMHVKVFIISLIHKQLLLNFKGPAGPQGERGEAGPAGEPVSQPHFHSQNNLQPLIYSPQGPKGDQGEKGDRGFTTTLNSDQFPTGIIEGPPGPPGLKNYQLYPSPFLNPFLPFQLLHLQR